MEAGQRVKIIHSLDKGKEGEITGKHSKSVPTAILQIGGDETPKEYCTVQLDDGHTNQYPMDYVEAIN